MRGKGIFRWIPPQVLIIPKLTWQRKRLQVNSENMPRWIPAAPLPSPRPLTITFKTRKKKKLEEEEEEEIHLRTHLRTQVRNPHPHLLAIRI